MVKCYICSHDIFHIRWNPKIKLLTNDLSLIYCVVCTTANWMMGISHVWNLSMVIQHTLPWIFHLRYFVIPHALFSHKTSTKGYLLAVLSAIHDLHTWPTYMRNVLNTLSWINWNLFWIHNLSLKKKHLKIKCDFNWTNVFLLNRFIFKNRKLTLIFAM